MNIALASGRGSGRLLLLAAAASMTALSALAAGPRDGGGSGDTPQNGVVRVRRGSPAGAESSVGVIRSTRPARAVETAAAQSEGLAPSGTITPDPAPTPGTTDEVVDTDPIKAGLPDGVEGEPDAGGGGGAGPDRQEIQFYDIGVRGKRHGRTITLWGAEFAFVNCDIQVTGGLPVGFSGAMGRIGENPGSASMIEFTLEAGGEVTLTVQPKASGSLTTPQRPVRTITMTVP